MSTFLLRARDPDMERWRAQSVRRGVSFAQHIRDSLEVMAELERTVDGNRELEDQFTKGLAELKAMFPVRGVDETPGGAGLGPDGTGVSSTGLERVRQLNRLVNGGDPE